MSEDGEMWAAYAEIRKAKKAQNYQAAVKRLELAGITYQTFNAGNMLRIIVDKGTVDYWPSTGLWIVRNTTPEFRGRGVGGLIFWLQRG